MSDKNGGFARAPDNSPKPSSGAVAAPESLFGFQGGQFPQIFSQSPFTSDPSPMFQIDSIRSPRDEAGPTAVAADDARLWNGLSAGFGGMSLQQSLTASDGPGDFTNDRDASLSRYPNDRRSNEAASDQRFAHPAMPQEREGSIWANAFSSIYNQPMGDRHAANGGPNTSHFPHESNFSRNALPASAGGPRTISNEYPHSSPYPNRPSGGFDGASPYLAPQMDANSYRTSPYHQPGPPAHPGYDPRMGSELFNSRGEPGAHHRSAAAENGYGAGEFYASAGQAYHADPRASHMMRQGTPPYPAASQQHAAGYYDQRELYGAPAAQSELGGCRFYASGFCSRGDRCNYEHGRTGAEPDRRGRRGRVSPEKKPAAGAGLGVDGAARYQSLGQVVGQVYAMCKDQHGCRFLQKKLEEKEHTREAVEIIFEEVYDHMVELMTDPFGNYLCQKLIEHCSEQQQLLIVQQVSSKLVEISQNMHGTRAVQKMIECLTSPAQVQLVVNALQSSVVPLIQDLNGNHVIQRCLHRLSVRDKQFIYDAVSTHCVAVATHRHGCCVMQRCIDSASQAQKLQLVTQISRNALTLVKDQFGNYVVQYVLDLEFPIVRLDLIREFEGHLAALSTQKFSSNVIEKCLHSADPVVQEELVDEIMQPATLSLLLQDPYGNYVIQTALNIAKPGQYRQLVEEIKPRLPALRNTPYGKRIQNKIAKDCIDN